MIKNSITNCLFKFWEFPISFPDPASVYAYHLFSVHHDIIWFLIVILIFVYWSLYKIVRDFNSKVFSKQSGFLLSFYKVVLFKKIITNIYCYLQVVTVVLADVTMDFRHFRNLHTMGKIGPVREWEIYAVKTHLWITDMLFGWRNSKYVFQLTLKDVEGKPVFSDEYYYLDALHFTHVIEFLVEDSEEQENFHHLNYLVNEKYLSYALFHYTIKHIFIMVH